jgi:UDP-N-acetylmuramyl pentapeptide phosphotransferase/UDP-N-acetylglucosamine-1-phosphate transferase
MSESLTALAGAPLLAFAVATLVAYILTRDRVARLALDRPNARSLHAVPVPRTGGIAVLIAALAAWFAFDAAPAGPVMAGLAILAVVSLLDDLRNLPPALRFLAHLGSAAMGVHFVAGASEPLAGQALLAIAVAWLINLYNFMDGSDGLAGGMALIGFLVYALAAIAAGDFVFASTNLIIAASAAGFLVFNFHPAKMFLGDVGSVPLGFLAGVLGLHGWMTGTWPLWFPIVAFSVFIVDSSVTLAKRLWNRERVWQAHRDHYYQRLVLMGWGHRRTAWVEYALMALTGVLALIALALPDWARFAVLGAVAIVYGLVIALVEHAWRSHAAARRQ